VSKPIAPDGYLLERLNSSLHSREEFACGVEALDVFLKEHAAQVQRKFLSATQVLVESSVNERPRQVRAFITLVSAQIPLDCCPEKFRKLSNKGSLPAMLLARMAVDLKHRNKGKRLGEFLLHIAFFEAVEQAERSGCSLLMVDVKPTSLDFYLRYGFMPLPENGTRLFLPVETIIKAARHRS
jgi:hypothetical protein